VSRLSPEVDHHGPRFTNYKQSNAKQSNAKQSKAKQCKAMATHKLIYDFA
jgi:hypothetical protein